MNARPTPKEVLSKIYGYPSFRGSQEEIIKELMKGHDCLALMPTGAGKSLCFQIPALCMDGTAIVISPLISLMQNQVMTLKQFGIKAEFINSSLSEEEYFGIMRDINNIKILYISPERFQMESFQNWLKNSINISFFAIDEAHCVSRWGHDFRPDYVKLNAIKDRFKKPIIALTATADLRTREDIPFQLGIKNYKLFISDFDRPNIKILVEEKENPKDQLMKFLKEFPKQSGIIYCLSRKKVEETTEFLKKQGYDAVAYHAGMPQIDRKNNQDHFILKEAVIAVATIAFGMGIDKPDVRFVVHLDMPQNLESFYQEIGRSGRDGDPAVSLLLYSLQDYALRTQMVYQSESTQKMSELGKVNEMLAFSETLSCKRNYLMRYFGNNPVPCENCESCLSKSETEKVTDLAKAIMITIKDTEQIYGMTYIALLLKGSNAKNVKEEHKLLPYYNSSKESDLVIKKTIRQLIVSQFLKIDLESGFNNLVVVKEIDADIFIKKANAQITSESAFEDSSDLFSRLKQLRLKLASEAGIPPYLVLHDKSLREMVKKMPKTISALSKIHGWGDKRLEKYGKIFLELIKSHK